MTCLVIVAILATVFSVVAGLLLTTWQPAGKYWSRDTAQNNEIIWLRLVVVVLLVWLGVLIYYSPV